MLRRPMIIPTKPQLLDLLETIANAALSISRRWDDDGIQPELRAEVLTNIYVSRQFAALCRPGAGPFRVKAGGFNDNPMRNSTLGPFREGRPFYCLP